MVRRKKGVTVSDAAPLTRVAEAGASEYRARRELTQQANAWVETELAKRRGDLIAAIQSAVEAGFSVTDIARAYTPHGKTPNRAKIYKLLQDAAITPQSQVEGFVGKWVHRTVATVDGDKTIYDLVATLSNFGPDGVTGEYTWTYMGEGQIEPSVDFEKPPYPSTKTYASALQDWLVKNPYPGVDQ